MNGSRAADRGQSWPKVCLADIGTLLSGQSPPTATVNRDAHGTAYVSGPEQWDGHKIHADKWTTDPKRIVPGGSIFITVKGAGVGKIFPGIEAAIGRDIYAFVPQKRMSARYVEHALRYSVQDVLRHAVGDIPGLSRKHILEHEIPVPPLAVQEKIVAEIEKQFSRLDEAVANVKRVKANLKRYKAAVLKTAVEGRLVPTEAELARRDGRRYETGAQLLRRILDARRSQWNATRKYKEPATPNDCNLPELPSGWVWTTIEALIVEGPQNGLYLPKALYGAGHPILRIDDFQQDWMRPVTELQCVQAEPSDVATYSLRNGDLVINRVNSPSHLGKVAVWESDVAAPLFESNMMRITLSPGVMPRFVAYSLRSLPGRARLTKQAKWAVNQASINQQDVRSTPIGLPPAAEQQRIVAEVDRRLSLVRELESMVDTNHTRGEALRRSLLAQSFSIFGLAAST